MANLLFANNASALLAASIDDDDTVIQVASGFGDLFPSPGANQFFYITLENASGDLEICKCTSRTDDNLTVVREQEGSTAQAWTLTVTRVELRLTAGAMSELLQLNGGSMTGDIDMNGNEIQDAILTGSSTSIQAGEIAGVPIRGATGVTGNQIVVPSNGTSRPTVGGVNVLLAGDDLTDTFAVGGVVTLDPTTRVDIGSASQTGVLRIRHTNGDYIQFGVDGTDVNITTSGLDEINLSLLLNLAATLRLNDQLLIGPVLQDFSVDHQSVTATSTTAIDYTNGSYVKLALDANISTLTLSNPSPSTGVATLRLKITQGSGGNKTITWPASVKWPNGIAPTLSTTAGDIDFVDLWTDDGGTTWFGAYNTDWS